MMRSEPAVGSRAWCHHCGWTRTDEPEYDQRGRWMVPCAICRDLIGYEDDPPRTALPSDTAELAALMRTFSADQRDALERGVGCIGERAFLSALDLLDAARGALENRTTMEGQG